MKNFLPEFNTRIFSFKRLFFIFSLISILFFVGTQTTSAIDTQSISANPAHFTDTDPRTKSWFIYTLPAGEKRTDSVIVTNNGVSSMTLKVYAADSVKTTDNGFALAQMTEAKSTIGAWVTMSTNMVTLGPKESKEIPFTISIPSNAKQGDYSGGIVFEQTVPQKFKVQGMGINLISRVGVRIYETVPGNNQLKVVVSNFHYTTLNNRLTFTFTAENKGTVHIAPTGVLIINDIFGREISRTTLDSMLDVLLPGKPVTITVPTQTLAPILGLDVAHVSLYYSPTLAASASSIILPPVWVIFGLILVVLILIGYFVFKKYEMTKTGKEQIKLTKRVKITVGIIIVGIIAFSWFITYLLGFFFGTK